MLGWNGINSFKIPGSVDGILENHNYVVRIDYDSLYMKSDFSDIRFTLEDDTLLQYHLFEKVDEDYAIFIIQVPTLPASPTETTILVYGDNSSASSLSTTDIYLFSDFCDGVFNDKWVISHAGGGSQGYDVVDGRPCIKLSNLIDACWITTKDYIAEDPFKVEFDIYLYDYIGLIRYMTSLEDVDSDHYRARLDNREGYNELIDKDGVEIGVSNNLGLTTGVWYPAVLGVSNGNHIWKINGEVGATAVDSDYTSGHLSFESTWDGFLAVARIRVSPTTDNPPIVGELSGWSDVLKEKVRFRSKFKVGIGDSIRFRAKLWIKHESARFRAKLMIVEKDLARFRSRIRIRPLHPVYIRDKGRFRSKLSIVPKEKARFRSKLNINTGETRIELFARVTMRREEFNEETPDFNFIVGDE